jgi:peptide-methionine (R)-S-oxide reductase
MLFNKRFFVISSIAIILLLVVIYAQEKPAGKIIEKGKPMNAKVDKSEKEWKETLSSEEFRVLREKGTERPFTGKYWNTFENGVYKCAACGEVLFDSQTKFDAGCGWPSFSEVINNKNVITKDDYSLGMHRVEVMCANCGGHLGHVFDDGPTPTGNRYCINSVSIKFEKKEK